MKSVQVERVADGYVVSRQFPNLASAQRAVDLLLGINEAAFAPAPPPAPNWGGRIPGDVGQKQQAIARGVAYDAHPHNPVSQSTGD